MSKKFIILKLRELEKEINILKEFIIEHYGNMNIDSEDIEFYLDLTKKHKQETKLDFGNTHLSNLSPASIKEKIEKRIKELSMVPDDDYENKIVAGYKLEELEDLIKSFGGAK